MLYVTARGYPEPSLPECMMIGEGNHFDVSYRKGWLDCTELLMVVNYCERNSQKNDFLLMYHTVFFTDLRRISCCCCCCCSSRRRRRRMTITIQTFDITIVCQLKNPSPAITHRLSPLLKVRKSKDGNGSLLGTPVLSKEVVQSCLLRSIHSETLLGKKRILGRAMTRFFRTKNAFFGAGEIGFRSLCIKLRTIGSSSSNRAHMLLTHRFKHIRFRSCSLLDLTSPSS